ncbi:MAG: hypothetical protein PHC64_05045, partial [Candidatus Gastranaerophilales bacterium]|nr:hypothetical protein [Candidatus Gastranaerophilales bacterium]
STGKSFIPGNTTACVAIVYDINGNQKPNVVGKDIGELNAVLGDDDCVQVGSMCVSKANVSFSPISEAPYTENNNYWAGAKKVCSDMGWDLPTYTELLTIFNLVKKNLGIKSLLSMSGCYWSSTEYDVSKAYRGCFVLSEGFVQYTKAREIYHVRCIK